MPSRSDLRLARAAAAAALLTAACDDAATFADPAADLELRSGAGQGGPIFNTHAILGSAVPAVDTTGQAYGGVTLVDVAVLQGTEYASVEPGSLFVAGGRLYGQRGDTTLSGPDFVGSRWRFQVGDATLTATLSTVETGEEAGLHDPDGTLQIRHVDPERLVYTFEYKPTDTGSPLSTCVPDAVGGARMVLLGDIAVDHTTGDLTERPDTIYFGCFSSAPGKAVLWGYAPDSPSLPSLSLPAYETAVRTVRADYCGSGVSYTSVGKELTLRDRWAINSHEPFAFKTEALWSVGGGALCVNRIRESGAPVAASLLCADGKKIPICGTTEAAVLKRWNLGVGALWTRIP